MKQFKILLFLLAGFATFMSCEDESIEAVSVFEDVSLYQNSDLNMEQSIPEEIVINLPLIEQPITSSELTGLGWCLEYNRLKIRRPKKNCLSGLWFCCDDERCGWVQCDDEEEEEEFYSMYSKDMVNIDFEFVKKNKLKLSFEDNLDYSIFHEEYDYFEGEVPIRVNIGDKSYVIPAGKYETKRFKGNLVVEVPLK